MAQKLLRGYRWEDPAHLIIFDFIMRFFSMQPEAIWQELPALLTRNGFPDFELPELARAVPARKVEAWMHQLALAKGKYQLSL